MIRARVALAAFLTVLALAPHGIARASSCKGALDLILDLASDALEVAAEVHSTATADEPCTETSDVHGHRRCSKFGSWGRRATQRRWFAEVGTGLRGFASPLGERTDSVTHDDQRYTYRVIGPAARPGSARALAFMSHGRVGLGLSHGAFVAAEGELGALTSADAQPEMVSGSHSAMPDIRSAGVTVTSGLGVVGWRLQVANLSLGVEAAAGFRAVTYHFDSSLRSCDTTTSITAWMPVVEGRASASYRVASEIALGATAGRSAIDDAWLAGVYIVVNSFE
jgi:hypothetical protein